MVKAVAKLIPASRKTMFRQVAQPVTVASGEQAGLKSGVAKASLELYVAPAKQIQTAAAGEEAQEVLFTAMASVMLARSWFCNPLGGAYREKMAPTLSNAAGAPRPTVVTRQTGSE